eukprot:18844_1
MATSEEKQNTNDAYTASTSTHSDDNWSDAEPIDPYNTELYQNNQTTNTEWIVSNDDEWICVNCNFPNNRRIAITENDCKCVNCKAHLCVNAASILIKLHNKSIKDEMKSENITQQEQIKQYIVKNAVSKLILSNDMAPTLLPIDIPEIENKSKEQKQSASDDNKQNNVETMVKYENTPDDKNATAVSIDTQPITVEIENKGEQISSNDCKEMNDIFLCSLSFEKCFCAQNIKIVLEEYDKLVNDKQIETAEVLPNKIH